MGRPYGPGRLRSACAWAVGCAMALVAAKAHAADGSPAAVPAALNELAAAERDAGSFRAAMGSASVHGAPLDARMRNAEALDAQRDWERAIEVLSRVVEKFSSAPEAVDALLLRSRVYYAREEYRDAARDALALLGRKSEPRGRALAPQAVARLADAAFRLSDPALADAVLEQVANDPSLLSDPIAHYAKGKAHYIKGDLAAATAAFGQVPASHERHPMAQYFIGLSEALRIRSEFKPDPAATPGAPPAKPDYSKAIQTFRALSGLKTTSVDHRHVKDLATLAVARLSYEMGRTLEAIDAYERVGSDSKELPAALYELGWVYARYGDEKRAQLTLQHLTIVAPPLVRYADGKLAHADLLLRRGNLDDALKVYEEVRGEFSPRRAQVEAVLDKHRDAPSLYAALLNEQLSDGAAPSAYGLGVDALVWDAAMESAAGSRVFRLFEDVRRTRSLLVRASDLAQQLAFVASRPSRVRLFPDLLAGQAELVACLNRVARARLLLAQELDRRQPRALGFEIGALRARRHQLMKRVAELPTTVAGLYERDAQSRAQIDAASQRLADEQRRAHLAVTDAEVVHEMLRDEELSGIHRAPASAAAIRAEAEEKGRIAAEGVRTAQELRLWAESARLDHGFGDARHRADAAVRDALRVTLEREIELAAAGQAGPDAAAFARQAQAALATATSLESRLSASHAELEAQVATRTTALSAEVAKERKLLFASLGKLEALIAEGQGVLAPLARESFVYAQERMRGLVMRADSGLTEEAWTRRERQTAKVRELQTTRARREQLLEEEQREVMEDALPGGAAVPTSPSAAK